MLIKAVIQSVLMYAMSMFRLPKGLIMEIQCLCARFLLGSNEKHKKIHRCTYDHMCKPKSEGEINGFLDYLPSRSPLNRIWTTMLRWMCSSLVMVVGILKCLGTVSIKIMLRKSFVYPLVIATMMKPFLGIIMVASTCHENKHCKMLSSNNERSRWTPLGDDIYKVNCDAANDKLGGLTGIGVIIRDHKDYGLESCVFEVDETTVVKWITDGSHNSLENGVLLNEIGFLCGNLKLVKFVHTPKEANRVARGLAIHALEITRDIFWIEEVPDCIKDLVKADKPS
ncbi:hypothetical protein Ddye_000011 [Dipteronia dyeriana]|uniref:RNase H type-1 domain-containing protein n=1 Tax=Dipteronia dyeriana TaxID=168575 RepID=A0AAE0CS53_9ROSI|nr:hypothetical protein Ddye_000011 [Dipteronia dyeriana]